MTPIDYGTNPAAAVGIPGINLNEATSAMTQLGFQNIRNLGANSNQPLITNQNDLQFFDNVTWLKGRHTLKAGGSVTLRSREILNADTIVGNFGFNNNQTSNCAGLASGCTINAATGFDVASFMLGFAASKTRNLFDAETYTETRPEYALYVQDDFRVTNKLTINAGLRWDVYVPWIEDGQPPVELRRGHRPLHRRVRQCGRRRRRSGPLPADLLEEGSRLRASAWPTTCAATAAPSSAAASASTGTSRPAARRRRRRRTRRSCSRRR